MFNLRVSKSIRLSAGPESKHKDLGGLYMPNNHI